MLAGMASASMLEILIIYIRYTGITRQSQKIIKLAFYPFEKQDLIFPTFQSISELWYHYQPHCVLQCDSQLLHTYSATVGRVRIKFDGKLKATNALL